MTQRDTRRFFEAEFRGLKIRLGFGCSKNYYYCYYYYYYCNYYNNYYYHHYYNYYYYYPKP